MCIGTSLGLLAKLTGKRVLVVEDEALVSMLVADELRGAGATVLGPALSLGDALRLVEAAVADGGMDAAVLDINLRGEAVMPVADKLAALGVPFLFATGYGEGRGTGGHGAAPTLQKPFSPESLVAAVEALASGRGFAASAVGSGARPGTSRDRRLTERRRAPVRALQPAAAREDGLCGRHRTAPALHPERPWKGAADAHPTG